MKWARAAVALTVVVVVVGLVGAGEARAEPCEGVRHLVFVDRSGKVKLDRTRIAAIHERYLKAHGEPKDCQRVDDFGWASQDKACTCLDAGVGKWDVQHLPPLDAAERNVCEDVAAWWKGRVQQELGVEGGPPIIAVVYAGATGLDDDAACGALAGLIRGDRQKHDVVLVWMQALEAEPPPAIAKLARAGRVYVNTLLALEGDREWDRGWKLGKASWATEKFKGTLGPGRRVVRPIRVPVDHAGWRPIRVTGALAEGASASISGKVELQQGMPGRDGWWLPAEGMKALEAVFDARLTDEALREAREPLIEAPVELMVDGTPQALEPVKLRTKPLPVKAVKVQTARPEPKLLTFGEAERGLELPVCRVAPTTGIGKDAQVLKKLAWKADIQPAMAHPAAEQAMAHLKSKTAAKTSGLVHSRVVEPFALPEQGGPLRVVASFAEKNGWVDMTGKCQRTLPTIGQVAGADGGGGGGLWWLLLIALLVIAAAVAAWTMSRKKESS